MRMDRSHRSIMDTCTVGSMPDLDVAVRAALELFADVPLPMLDLGTHQRPLVVGSGNALVTGRVLFDEQDAIFASESTYRKKLHLFPVISGATIISASGGKHAAPIAEHLAARKLDIRLFTTTADAPASAFVPEGQTFVFPKNREPFSYNTSTYMGMLLAKTKEDPTALHTFVGDVLAQLPDTLGDYDAFFFLIPEQFAHMREMFITKCEELFSAHIAVRVYTHEQAKHAQTIVPHERELFVSFGAANEHFGLHTMTVPLPEEVHAAGMMAVGYSVIGAIQRAHPPYFKDNVQAYAHHAEKLFGHPVTPIVD